jgi:hypothetical protein
MIALSTLDRIGEIQGKFDLHYSTIPKHCMLKPWYIL